ncbi:MAG: cobalamin biosynthesis protein [Lachnospiraceae bacterium]|nr:cobalamin biosynthesis protein [Lachnospiraceae bacterium]
MSFELKKVVLISFTAAGDRLAYEIEKALLESGFKENPSCRYECERYCYESYNAFHGISFQSGRKVLENVFNECESIIFIGACGMAVRMMNGLACSKDKDPGIVVVDSEGKFAISFLSGHLGGANALTEQIANMIGAIPVITTATDVGKKFSPDMFAKKNHLYITDLTMAKIMAKAVLEGEGIAIESDGYIVNVKETAPINSENHFHIYIGLCTQKLQKIKEKHHHTLWLIPRDLVIGVGCKKNTDVVTFENEMIRRLQENEIDVRRVRELHTIDIKKNEPAIRSFAKKYNLVCRFYHADELRNVQGDFLASEFVERITGVDNVCERSALIDAEKLIVRKCAQNGITFAVAQYEKWRIIAE